MQNPGSSTRLTLVKEKVLALVSTFFCALILLKVNEINDLLYYGIIGRNCLRIVARFKSKSATGNLNRENEKMPLSNPSTGQELKGAVSKSSVWW